MLLLMYCAGPFNFHPLKLPMQYIFGSSYHRAYRHFRNNHSIPVNIVAHLLGLAHILLANFALLHEVDARVLEPAGFTFGVTLPTALMWGLLLTVAARSSRVCSWRACGGREPAKRVVARVVVGARHVGSPTARPLPSVR
jgi:hypothetical protein